MLLTSNPAAGRSGAVFTMIIPADNKAADDPSATAGAGPSPEEIMRGL